MRLEKGVRGNFSLRFAASQISKLYPSPFSRKHASFLRKFKTRKVEKCEEHSVVTSARKTLADETEEVIRSKSNDAIIFYIFSSFFVSIDLRPSDMMQFHSCD